MRAAWRRAWTRARAARARPRTACTARWAPCTSSTACSSPVPPRSISATASPASCMAPRVSLAVCGFRSDGSLLLAGLQQQAPAAHGRAPPIRLLWTAERARAPGRRRARGRPRWRLPGPARGVSAGAPSAQARPRRCTCRAWSVRPRWLRRRQAARRSPRRRRRRSRARWRAWRSGCCSATTRRRAAARRSVAAPTPDPHHGRGAGQTDAGGDAHSKRAHSPAWLLYLSGDRN